MTSRMLEAVRTGEYVAQLTHMTYQAVWFEALIGRGVTISALVLSSDEKNLGDASNLIHSIRREHIHRNLFPPLPLMHSSLSFFLSDIRDRIDQSSSVLGSSDLYDSFRTSGTGSTRILSIFFSDSLFHISMSPDLFDTSWNVKVWRYFSRRGTILSVLLVSLLEVISLSFSLSLSFPLSFSMLFMCLRFSHTYLFQ